MRYNIGPVFKAVTAALELLDARHIRKYENRPLVGRNKETYRTLKVLNKAGMLSDAWEKEELQQLIADIEERAKLSVKQGKRPTGVLLGDYEILLLGLSIKELHTQAGTLTVYSSRYDDSLDLAIEEDGAVARENAALEKAEPGRTSIWTTNHKHGRLMEYV